MKSILAILFMIVPFSSLISQEQTAQVMTWSGEIDGVPVWVTVNAQDRNFTSQQLAGLDWSDWGNTTTDAYILAINSPENVRLIVDFNLNIAGGAEAQLFVNNLGQENLDYQFVDGKVKVLSNAGHPFATFKTTESGTWLVDGDTNYNLHITVDGPSSLRDAQPESASKTDGVVDSEIYVGSEQPGIAQWQLGQVVNDPRPQDIYERFGVAKRMDNAPDFSVAPSWIPGFPYLGVVGRSIDYFQQNRCPFYFDVRSSTLNYFGFIGQQSGIYAINSSTPPPFVDFEAPFAWYNFDPASRYPQLAVRSWYYPSNDPLVSKFNSKIPGLSTFRYSWKVNDEQDWAYSLQVAGAYAYSELVKIGPVEFYGIPGDRLPGWVVSQPWDITTFVEAVNGYPGGEGIYFYSPQILEVLNYFYGQSQQMPSYYEQPFLQDTSELLNYYSLPAGFRGEYQLDHSLKPLLYFSPVDNNLHLKYAQGGFWYLGNGLLLRSVNLNGDPFQDGWIKEKFDPAEGAEKSFQLPQTQEIQSLYQLGNFLVFSAHDRVIIQNAGLPFEISEFTPPADQESWLLFKERLLQMSAKKDPANLAGWLTGVGGQQLAISNAKISNVQLGTQGFSFVLELSLDSSFSGDLENPFQGLPAGRYFVEYALGQFHLRPFRPPQVEFAAAGLDFAFAAPLARQPVRLTARLRNLGDAPASLSAALWASLPGQAAQLVSEQPLSLPALQDQSLAFLWTPLVPGDYTLEIRLGGEGLPEGGLSAPAALHVAPAGQPSLEQAWLLTRPAAPWLAGIQVCGLSLGAAFLALYLLRRQPRKADQDR